MKSATNVCVLLYYFFLGISVCFWKKHTNGLRMNGFLRECEGYACDCRDIVSSSGV